MADVFVSFSTKDLPLVQQIVVTLERRGLAVWWSQRLGSGPLFVEEIEREIAQAACVALVWTRDAKRSRWVKAEIHCACAESTPVLPFACGTPKPPAPHLLLREVNARVVRGAVTTADIEAYVDDVVAEIDRTRVTTARRRTTPARHPPAQSAARGKTPRVGTGASGVVAKGVAGVHGDGPGEASKAHLLVIALQRLRPSQDLDATATLRSHIEAYKAHLDVVARSVGDGFPPDSPLFAPVQALLWGTFDQATMYLADDFESASKISRASGAAAEEFVFGHPIDDESATAIRALFENPVHYPSPILAITRIKIADHLLSAAGGTLFDAIGALVAARRIDGVTSVLLRSWSWPELILLSFSDSPQPLFEIAAALEHATVDELRRRAPAFDAALRAACDSLTVTRLLATWLRGAQPAPATRDELLRELGRCDAIVAARTHVGLLPHAAASLAREHGLPVGALLHRMLHDPAWVPEAEAFEPELAAMGEPGTRTADESRQLVAHVAMYAKPGHFETVRAGIAALSGRLPHVAASSVGLGRAAVLGLNIAPTLESFLRLALLGYLVRKGSDLGHHLLLTTTTFEWPLVTPKPTDLKASRGGGYGLLRTTPHPQQIELERSAWHEKGIGRVSAEAFDTFSRSLSDALSKPEMHGVMIELWRTIDAVQDLLVGGAPRTTKELNGALTQLLPLVHAAFYQRVQSSFLTTGIPQFATPLPFGVAQLLRIVDGTVAVIIQAAFRTGTVGATPADVGRFSFVSIAPDPGIGLLGVLHVNVFRLSVLQALTPLSLAALYHEMGHVLVRAEAWRTDEGSDWERFEAETRAWREACRTIADSATPPDATRDLPPRYEAFLEDIFAHSVWRRLGCHDDWDLFETQLLACQGMGLRLDNDLLDGVVSLQAWAESMAHLVIQNLLARSHDRVSALPGDLRRWLDAFEASADADHVFDEATLPDLAIFQAASSFAAGELTYALLRLRPAAVAQARHDPEKAAQSYCGTLARCLRKYFLPLLRGLAALPEKDEYLARLQRLSEAAARAQEAIGPPDDWERAVAREVRAGQEPRFPPGEALDADGDPSPKTFRFVRGVLGGITSAFRDSQQPGPPHRCVFRDERMRYDGLPGAGVYVDFAGGLFLAGQGTRARYSMQRIAALSALWEVSTLVSAGPITSRLCDRRREKRIVHAETVDLRAGTPDGWIPTETIDVSSRGLRVRRPARLKLKRGDRVSIRYAGTSSRTMYICNANDTQVGLSADLVAP